MGWHLRVDSDDELGTGLLFLGDSAMHIRRLIELQQVEIFEFSRAIAVALNVVDFLSGASKRTFSRSFGIIV